MKKMLWLQILIIITAARLSAHQAVSSVDAFRPEDSHRNWLFYIGDQRFGTLESVAKGEASLDDLDGFRFDQDLKFDYTPLGNAVQIAISSQHFVNAQGHYLGDRMNASAGPQKQEMLLKRSADSVTGYVLSGGVREERGQAIPADARSVDNNMLDQMEMYLAFQNFGIGDTLADTVFVPQILAHTPMRFAVEGFAQVRYGDIIDSAYVLHFLEPQDQMVYFTRDNRLVKIELTGQNINIILSEDPHEKLMPPSGSAGFSGFVARLPLYLVYVLFAGLFSIFVIRRYYRSPEIYFIFILGCAMYSLLGSTQIPLQKWYSLNVLIPAVREGGSLFTWGMISALITGVVQEILKLFPLILAWFFRKPDHRSMVAYGLFCGLGFGFLEACSLTGAAWQAGAIDLFSWSVFERFFAMLFHAASGALLGYAMSSRLIGFSAMLVGAILYHSLINYSIIFYQKRFISVSLLESSIAFLDIIFAVVVFLIVRNARNDKAR